jgi:hypothetical protein
MTSSALKRGFEAAAVGRIVWGLAALAAPGLNVRAAGIRPRDTPEVRYLVRIFGARAAALGIGYLLSSDEERRARPGRLARGRSLSDQPGRDARSGLIQ